jgi:solute carrier family 25 carnitine/acylcarnitine transporter 20/29
VVVGHPFDTIKVRLQTSNQYTGIVDCVKKTGLTGLYRGIASPLVGVTPMFALSFWSYDMGQKAVYSLTPNRKSRELSLTEYAVAGTWYILILGALSAFPTTIITTPMERVKVVLQTQGQDPKAGTVKYSGMTQAARGMWAEGGIASLYRGTVATLARDIPGSAAYFVSYEATARALRPADGSLSIGAELFAGGMAGVAMWSIAIPPE